MPVPVLRLSPPGPYDAPPLDPAQERVVSWTGPGTCVVLGSPGTGATTAIVESVVAHLSVHPSARTLVLEAIARGKHVVTANKALLAKHGMALAKAGSKGVLHKNAVARRVSRLSKRVAALQK